MKHSFKKLPGSKIELEVALDQKEFLSYYKEVYDQALVGVQIKGFRPGMAPKEMADQAVDKEKVFNEAARNAVRWSLDEVSKDNKWTLIDTPRIEIEDSKDLGIKYKAELTIFPEIKLGDYKKIARKILAERKDVKVEPKEIEQTLEWVRNSRKPRRTDNNKNNEVGTPTEASEEKDKIPELNDEFAKSIGKFQNMEELKKSVRDGLLMEKQMKETDRLRLKMLEEIIKASEIDLPEIMVRKTYENMNSQFGPMLKASGPDQRSRILDSGREKSEQEIETQLKERARNNVASNLVINKIAQVEKLEPKPAAPEVGEPRLGEPGREEIDDGGDYQHNYGVIQQQKVFSFLEKQ